MSTPFRERGARLGTRARVARRRAKRLPPAVRGMLWMILSGLFFSSLNALLRKMTLVMDPLQAQFLRYLFGVVVMLPLVLRSGLLAFKPNNIRGQFTRGFVHAAALSCWFIALPHLPLADTTAIGFTGPIFTMFGAAFFFKEPMRWDRWTAALIGFGGILVVVGPRIGANGGLYALVMLASAPLFAGSFLITKALTRYESAQTIVMWQALTVSALSLPFALAHWQAPTLGQWLVFTLCGLLGSIGHYCLTRAFSVADISASQPAKFLDLVWSSLLGWLMFSDQPSQYALLGGSVICASTIWITRREARARKRASAA